MAQTQPPRRPRPTSALSPTAKPRGRNASSAAPAGARSRPSGSLAADVAKNVAVPLASDPLRPAASANALAPGLPTPRALFEHLAALDFDGDGRLTARDAAHASKNQLRFGVDLHVGPGLRLELTGAERLAHVADVLGELILDGHGDTPGLPTERLLEGRALALRKLVDRSWDGLVRRSDRIEDLAKALQVMPVQSKDGKRRVYVPAADRKALKRLRAEAARHPELEVVALDTKRDQQTWRELGQKPGMLYLPRPYVVPGGRFVQMFGWDSYFNGRGALASGRYEFARDLLENYLYDLEHYGKIPNSNLSYHLSRTQPPLMPRLALELHAARPYRAMLERVAKAAAKELDTVFRTGPRATGSGLSRYKDDAEGPDAEDLSAFYEHRRNDAEFHLHDRAIRESGWDTCHRFGEATHHFEPVCLNSLLYRYEMDLAELHRILEGEGSAKAEAYAEAAKVRARTMRARFWDAEQGLFFDYDFVAKRRSRYECLATFYPLWTGWASKREAAAVAAALPRFLQAGGLVSSSRASREAAGGEDLQWDWPFGWPPHQIIAVEGLRRYGFHAEADAVAYRWLSMVLDIAGDNNGLLKEKYDVVHRSAEVAVEYGNQGADRGPHLAPRVARSLGFAWTNASVVLLMNGLSPRLRDALDAGVPPDRAVGAL